MRACTRCAIEKPRTAEFFPPHAAARDGLGSYCRSCKAEIGRAYRAQVREQRNAKERERRAALRAVGAWTDTDRAEWRDRPYAIVAYRLQSRTIKVLGRYVPREEMDRLTGCSAQEAAHHVESKFAEGMAWENHDQWELDHVQPLASFDLTDPAQLAAACHITNIQPLWPAENRAKGARSP